VVVATPEVTETPLVSAIVVPETIYLTVIVAVKLLPEIVSVDGALVKIDPVILIRYGRVTEFHDDPS